MWTDGASQIPCDYRLYNKQQDNLTKNDHFQALIVVVYQKGFAPACAVNIYRVGASTHEEEVVRFRQIGTNLVDSTIRHPIGMGKNPHPLGCGSTSIRILNF